MVGAGEFVEIPARHFHDHIIERGFKKGRSVFCDLVVEFVQTVADGEFGGYFGNRVARRLAGQSRGARHPRVDLNDDHVFRIGVHGKLYVAAAREIAQRAHGRNGLVSHALIGRIRQRHGRRHGDAVAGVDAHRVKVFHHADDDHVVCRVAQQFQFVLLPAQ